MRVKAFVFVICLISLFIVLPPAFAHHSMAVFDATKTVTVTGVVTQFSYTNPHIYVYARIERDGQTANFRVEAGSPSAMKEKGWSSKSLQVGDKITILAHPAKNNPNFGTLILITKANGTRLETTLSPEFEVDGLR